MRRAITHPYLFPALAVFVLLAGGVVATTAAQRSSNQVSVDAKGQNLEFSIVPVRPQGAPSGYVVGSGDVEIELRGISASVEVDLENANPNTSYTVVLRVDNKSTTVGTMTTNEDGEGELEATITLPEGSHQISLQLIDATTFGSPTLVGTSNPTVLTASVATSTISEEGQGDDEQGQSNQTGMEQENEPGSD